MRKWKCFILFAGVLLALQSTFGQSPQERLDSLKVVVKALGPTEVEKGMALAEEAMEIAIRSGEEANKGKAFHILGIAFRLSEKDEQAYRADLRALSIHHKLNLARECLIDHVNLGVDLEYINQPDSALDHYFSALRLANSLEDDYAVAVIHNNLANLYGKMGRPNRSLEQAFQARDGFRKVGNDAGLANILSTIATNHRTLGDLDAAEEAQEEALFLRAQLGDTLLWYKTRNELASLRLDQGRNQEALQLVETTLDYLQRIDFRTYYLSALFTQGIALANLERYDQGLAVLNLIEREARAQGDHLALRDAYKHRGWAYYDKGDFKRAFDDFEVYHQLKDSLFGEEIKLKVEELETVYQTEKLRGDLNHQQALLAVERRDKQAKEDELARLYLILFGSLGLLLLGGLIAFLLVRQSRLKARFTQLDLEQKALKAQMNPHFLFNALNSIQSCILHEDKQVAYNYHSKFATLMRMVLVHSEQKVIPLNMELEALELYLSLEQLRSSHHFAYQIEVSEGINTTGVQVPSMLIQPFVENAIWHGVMNKKSPGEIGIRIKEQEEGFVVEIGDDGVGREAAQFIKSSQRVNYKSVGMELTRQRLRLFNYKKRKKLTFEVVDKFLKDGQPAGTLVQLFIPKTQAV